MRSRRIRYLLVLFAAMLLANSAVASARACVVHLAAPGQAAGGVVVPGGDGQPCPTSDATTDCPVHVTQIYNSNDPNLFFDAPTVALAPPMVLHRFVVPTGARRLVVASAPLIVGPPLTILFHNLRN